MRTIREKLEIRIPGIEADVAVWMVALDRSCVVWVGDAVGVTPVMPQLAVGMPPLQGKLPVSSMLLDDDESSSNDFAESLSRRLAQRTGMQIFASEALRPDWKTDDLLMQVLEKKLATFVVSQFTSTEEGCNA